MKFMNTINELQKKLTKLRREIQRSEAGKVEGYACRKCGRTSRVVKLDRLCPFCDFDPPEPAFTTRECICYPGILGSHRKCPVHGKHPDLPLHVRVAKALGEKPYFGNGVWYIAVQLGSVQHEPENWEVKKVIDYPNDLVAAMGALEEYCSIDGINFGMARCDNHTIPRGTFIKTLVTIGKGGTYTSPHKSLPQAICEAIVAHKEGR